MMSSQRQQPQTPQTPQAPPLDVPTCKHLATMMSSQRQQPRTPQATNLGSINVDNQPRTPQAQPPLQTPPPTTASMNSLSSLDVTMS